jgi:HSP20 family molecular chaperone IbpA
MTFLTRGQPFGELSTMQDRINLMNRLFRESYTPEGPEEALTTTSFAPPVDIYEDEHTIAVKMEVPGIDEKDIDVRIKTTLSRSRVSARSRRTRKKRISVGLSDTMEASPARSRSRVPSIWRKRGLIMTRAC